MNEFIVTLSLFVTDICQIRVSLFTVLSDHTRIIELVLLEERFGVVIGVDIDLC
jgi:hypothetical protein